MMVENSNDHCGPSVFCENGQWYLNVLYIEQSDLTTSDILQIIVYPP